MSTSSQSVPAARLPTAMETGARTPASMSGLMDWTLLIVPGLVWGSSFLFIAEGLEALAPDGVTFMRFLIGFATLSLVPAARKPVLRSDWRGIFWLGVLWLAFPMSMFPHAEQHVSSALVGMLNGTVPLVAAVVASVLEKKWPASGVVIGLIIGLTGGVLMALPAINAGGNEAMSVLLIVLAVIAYGIALNLARPLQQRNGALPVVWRALGVALILTAPIGGPHLLDAQWSWRAALSILALGALGTALANVVMAVAAGRLGATRASATVFLIPVVALALGVLLRAEQVAVLSLAGVALCLIGAWYLRRATLRAA